MISLMRVATVELDVRTADVDGNLAAARAGVERAAAHGASLVALPEMWPTSFVPMPRAEVFEESDRAVEAIVAGQMDVAGTEPLHLVEDRAATVRWLFERLRPGGTFVASTVCLGKRAWFFAPLIFLMRLFGKAPRVWFVTPEQLVDEMREAGFVDVERVDVGAKDTVAFTLATKPA